MSIIESKIKDLSLSEQLAYIETLKVEDLTDEDVLYLDKISKDYDMFQYGIKIIINSIYGAFGNEWFTFYNPDVAESITLQGQNIILYIEEQLNNYFKTYWHKDTELHEKLGITKAYEVKNNVGLYIDTDSVASDSIIDINEQIIKLNFDCGLVIEHKQNDKIIVLRENEKIEIFAKDILKTDLYVLSKKTQKSLANV